MYHMEIATACVACLPQAVTAYFAGDREALNDSRQDILRLKSAAVPVLEDIQDGLGRSMFLPVDRRDLLDVVQVQEAIADLAQDIAGLLLDLLPNVPRELHRPVAQLVAQGVAATGRAQQIVDSFEGIVEAGFHGGRVDATHGLIRSLVAMEEGVDAGRRQIAATLFAQYREMDPAASVLFYRLLGQVAALTAMSGRLALRARLMLVH